MKECEFADNVIKEILVPMGLIDNIPRWQTKPSMVSFLPTFETGYDFVW